MPGSSTRIESHAPPNADAVNTYVVPAGIFAFESSQVGEIVPFAVVVK